MRSEQLVRLADLLCGQKGHERDIAQVYAKSKRVAVGTARDAESLAPSKLISSSRCGAKEGISGLSELVARWHAQARAGRMGP